MNGPRKSDGLVKSLPLIATTLPSLDELPQCFSKSPFNDLSHKNRDTIEVLQLRVTNDFEVVQTWLQRFSQQPLTFRAYRKESFRLLLWCYVQQKALGQLDVVDLDQFIMFLRNPLPHEMWCSNKPGGRGVKQGSKHWKPFVAGLSEKAVTQSKAALCSLFSFLVTAGYLRRNPMKLLNEPRRDPYQERYFEVYERIPTPEEWHAILHALDHWGNRREQIRLRFIIAMLFYTGLRISELANLSWSSFRKTQNGWSLFVIGKGNKKREIAVEDLLFEVMKYRQHLKLSIFPKPHEFEPVVRDLENQHGITASYIFKLIKKLAIKASETMLDSPLSAKRLRQFSPHWIRHLCPSLLTKAGVDQRYIQNLLGHSSADTTNIYIHLFDEGRRAAVRQLNLHNSFNL